MGAMVMLYMEPWPGMVLPHDPWPLGVTNGDVVGGSLCVVRKAVEEERNGTRKLRAKAYIMASSNAGRLGGRGLKNSSASVRGTVLFYVASLSSNSMNLSAIAATRLQMIGHMAISAYTMQDERDR